MFTIVTDDFNSILGITADGAVCVDTGSCHAPPPQQHMTNYFIMDGLCFLTFEFKFNYIWETVTKIFSDKHSVLTDWLALDGLQVLWFLPHPTSITIAFSCDLKKIGHSSHTDSSFHESSVSILDNLGISICND